MIYNIEMEETTDKYPPIMYRNEEVQEEQMMNETPYKRKINRFKTPMNKQSRASLVAKHTRFFLNRPR